MAKGFICKTGKPWVFYVNPAYAFNGNRITLVTEYFLKDEKSEVSFDNPEPPVLKEAVDGQKLEYTNDFE